MERSFLGECESNWLPLSASLPSSHYQTMHKAPTVDYPLGRSRFQAFTLALVFFCVVSVDGTWFYLAADFGWRQWLGLAVTLVALLAALRAWHVSSSGILRWDGQSWSWETAGSRSMGTVRATLDLQRFLLLCFCADAGTRQWLWLEQSRAANRWSALRRAVYAPMQSENAAGQTASPVARSLPGDVTSP